MTNKNKQEWKKFYEAWAKEGRTEEQKWAVKNFLTGQGAIMISSLLTQEKKRIIREIKKLSKRMGDPRGFVRIISEDDLDSLNQDK